MIRALSFTGALFISMVALMELGRFLRRRRDARYGVENIEGLGTIEAAAFGLLGLLLAFAFAGATERFENRRDLAVEEANAILAAYQELDVLPPARRGPLQEQMRQYADVRLAFYRALPDAERAKVAIFARQDLQRKIWGAAVVAVSEAPNTELVEGVLETQQTMYGFSARRVVLASLHPPTSVYGLLGVVMLLCTLLAGFDMRGARNWLQMVTLPLILAMTLYTIVDVEYPRGGLLRINNLDYLLVNVRERMQ